MEAVSPDAWQQILGQLDNRSLCRLSASSRVGRQASFYSNSLDVELEIDKKLVSRLQALLKFLQNRRQSSQVTCFGSAKPVGALQRGCASSQVAVWQCPSDVARSVCNTGHPLLPPRGARGGLETFVTQTHGYTTVP